MRTIIIAVVAGVLSLFGSATAAHAQGFKVIANNSVSSGEVPASALSKVFLKQSTKLPDGTAVSPVDQNKDSKVRAAFSKSVHGRAVSAIETFWQQQIFSGKEVPPATKATDAEIVAFVKATAGGIGYVSEGAATDGVKVILVK